MDKEVRHAKNLTGKGFYGCLSKAPLRQGFRGMYGFFHSLKCYIILFHKKRTGAEGP